MLWNDALRQHDMTVLCAYAVGEFDRDVTADYLKAVSREHTHLLPLEETPPDSRDRTGTALLRTRTRALTRLLAPEPQFEACIYIVDDDMSVRRSLRRLLVSIGFEVRAFESAEAFLAAVPPSSRGCLVLDVHLMGLNGPDLQNRMARETWAMPVVAMSGSHDIHTELQMRALGATAFLRKPFDAHEIVEAITRAVS
jgi:CheY-like chemotaxis protein